MRSSTWAASSSVAPSQSKSSAAVPPPCAANSAGRLRVSSSRLNEATSHWRTLPFKCSSRLPIEFEASLGRHQICSLVSDSTHVFMRGQCCSKRSFREESRKSAVSSESVVLMEVDASFGFVFSHISKARCGAPLFVSMHADEILDQLVAGKPVADLEGCRVFAV